jgi:methyl farnesoate epoxidase/farnesoate epoxidase
VFVDGPEWTEQKKFCMQHLRKKGFGGDLMEKLISEEVDDLILHLNKRYEVQVCFKIFYNYCINVLLNLMYLEW